tara:strand:- start:14492 stop:15208 length:717 start_codon:yes stop_codon:yes gene_type:complete
MSQLKKKIDGSLIALAWPQTQVVKEGKWYDTVTEFLGFIKNGKYTVGHAALILINHENGTATYYDFGRYHTPFQTGRVRGAITDPDLKMHTKAIITNGEVSNLDEVLLEIAQNPSNHGDGIMYASMLNQIDFQKAQNEALRLQNMGIIAYSPLNNGSTNCSRFVAQVANSTSISIWQKIALKIPYTFAPSPRSNIRILGTEKCYYTVDEGIVNKYAKSFYSLFEMFQDKKMTFQTEQV